MPTVMESLAAWLAGSGLDASVKDNIFVIGEGIDSLKKISFKYFTKSRVVEPYVVSLVLSGNPWVNVYQTGGSSNGARIIGWKTFMVRSIKDVKLLSEVFEVRPFYYDVPFFWNRHRIIWIP